MTDKFYANDQEYIGDLTELALLSLEACRSGESDDYAAADERREFIRRRVTATLQAGQPISLEYLWLTTGLTPFQQHCVTLALAAELEIDVGSAIAELLPGYRLPTLDLCLRSYSPDPAQRVSLAAEPLDALADYFCASLLPDGAQGEYQHGRMAATLRIDGRIAAFAAGNQQSGDRELEDLIKMFWPWEEIEPLVVGAELPGLIQARREGTARGMYYLYGEAGSGKKLCLRHILRDTPLVTADLRRLITPAENFPAKWRKIRREAKLLEAALCLTHLECLTETENGERLAQLLQLLRGSGLAEVFLTGAKAWRPETAEPFTFIDFEVTAPDITGRLRLWETALRDVPLAADVTLPELAAKFSFTGGQIEEAVARARGLAQGLQRETLDSALFHQACRAQISHRMGEKAVLVPTRYSWNDLVLPPSTKNMLRNACDQVRFNQCVYGEWGFAEKIAYGRGLSMLFSGPPGTGKTMGAQVVAHELQLELYKVDLSGVVSKYIGETEQNLQTVFAEVKKSQSILFFDEADSLFGKRSETKDAHDRYANIETSYLLQKMEDYEGIIILATNFAQNFDDAFRRRIKFIIEFPPPDEAYRLQIWEAVFPARLPLADDVDFSFLAANFVLTGAGIKNAAVAAAFLAARRGGPVTMADILAAVVFELRKSGKKLLKEDLKEYFQVMEALDAGE